MTGHGYYDYAIIIIERRKKEMNKWYIVSKLTCICALAVIVAVFAK